MTGGNVYLEIAVLLSLATLLGIVGQRFRQPSIIMFLATGILAGPAGFGVLKSFDQIELLAQMGVALLLFVVGLKLDVNLVRTIGPVALAAALGQIIFTAAIAFALGLAMDMTLIGAAYVAVAITFSSTIIVVKLLSDKKEIDSLHGQIAVGILIVQDIAALLALVGLTTFGTQAEGEAPTLVTTLFMVLKGFGLLGVVALLTVSVLPRLTRRLAHSQEMLTLFAIAWAVFLGAGSELLGFNKEVGAFIAGVSLASSGYRDSIAARLTSLRDFLLLFFFIDLGARLDWSTVGSQVGAAALISLFVLIGKPLIVMAIMGIMGYRRRTGFLAGLSIAQISEFSFILAALGLSIGDITPEMAGLITLVGVVTFFVSTYMILYTGALYRLLFGLLRVFERRNPYRETAIDSLKDTSTVDAILVGLGNYGGSLAECLLRRHKAIMGVDFDPGVLGRWGARGIPVLYGDMADPEIHKQLPLNKAHWVVSSVRSRELNLALLQLLKNRGYDGKVALTATNQEEADLFAGVGAHVVFRPFVDAAEQAVDALTHSMDFLPENVNWPITFREVRVRSEASVVGQTIRNIPLRSMTGVSILAISRAGRVHYELDPDFQIYPGDRLVIVGPPKELEKAESMLNQFETNGDAESTERFEIAEVDVAADSPLLGQTLAELRFRQRHGVTVVGIQRGENQITTPAPTERLLRGDSLMVIGNSAAVARLRQSAPL